MNKIIAFALSTAFLVACFGPTYPNGDPYAAYRGTCGQSCFHVRGLQKEALSSGADSSGCRFGNGSGGQSCEVVCDHFARAGVVFPLGCFEKAKTCKEVKECDR